MIVVDVAVVGGGPAGLAAALWAARYRRRVLLLDGGRPRNDRSKATHGYLGHEGVAPADLLDHACAGLAAYPEIQAKRDVVVDTVTLADSGGFDLELDTGSRVRALRLVLATGVRDVFPDIEHFESFFGTSIFACPSCDGYEAQDRSVAVLGDDDELAALAIGLLDWARFVTVIRAATGNGSQNRALAQSGVEVIEGEPVTILGEDGHVRAIRLADGGTVNCDMVFCNLKHVQRSDLPIRLGCRTSPEGCVVVDDHCRTSIEHVYAAGDMTPGPHLVQVAASKGAIAGIAAATSLRGERGAPAHRRPPPMPIGSSKRVTRHSGLDTGSTGDGVCVSNRIDRLALPDVTGVRHRRVACRGLSFHVAEAGDGEPLVFLHGWPQNWYCWRRVVPLLPGRRLIMPDLRGHGWSDAPREEYEKENLVDDVLALMDTLELDVVGLVGHDWGGWTGFLAALRAPERFSALLALGIVHPFQTPTLATALQAWRGAYQLFLASPVIAQAALRASPQFVAAAISAATVRDDANSDAERRFYGEVLRDPARARATTQLYSGRIRSTWTLAESCSSRPTHRQRSRARR